LIFQI